jgi:hypothetical protein
MHIAYVVFVIVACVGSLVWLGFQFAKGKLEDDQEKLDSERQVLDAEWTALEQTRRVNDVFFSARDAMRRAQDEAGGSDSRRPPRPGV